MCFESGCHAQTIDTALGWLLMRRCTWRAGFTGVTDFEFWGSGALLALNTFAAHLLTALLLPLLVLPPGPAGSSLTIHAVGRTGKGGSAATAEELHVSVATLDPWHPAVPPGVRASSCPERVSNSGGARACAYPGQVSSAQLTPVSAAEITARGHAAPSDAAERCAAQSRPMPSQASGSLDSQATPSCAAERCAAQALAQAALAYGLLRALTAGAAMLSAAIQRRHIMAWALFAPKSCLRPASCLCRTLRWRLLPLHAGVCHDIVDMQPDAYLQSLLSGHV